MRFGPLFKELRMAHDMTQKKLADQLGVSASYICKDETERLHFGDYPSIKFIRKLAEELDTEEDELLPLSERVATAIEKRIRQRPDAFREFAAFDDRVLDRLLETASRRSK